MPDLEALKSLYGDSFVGEPRIELMAKVSTPNRPDGCVATLDGVSYASTEFVAILTKPDGDAGFYYNADALTMGMAMRMCAKAFAEMLNELDELERTEIKSILGGTTNEQDS